jgi:hypothetical protein
MDCLTLKMKAVQSFEMSQPTHLTLEPTQPHVFSGVSQSEADNSSDVIVSFQLKQYLHSPLCHTDV